MMLITMVLAAASIARCIRFFVDFSMPDVICGRQGQCFNPVRQRLKSQFGRDDGAVFSHTMLVALGSQSALCRCPALRLSQFRMMGAIGVGYQGLNAQRA